MGGEAYEYETQGGWDLLATAGVFAAALSLLTVWGHPLPHPLVWDDVAVAAGLRPPADPFPGVYRGLLALLFQCAGVGSVLDLLPWMGRVLIALATAGVYAVFRDILPAVLRLQAHIGRIGGAVGRLVAAVAALLFLCADPVWRAGQTFSPTTVFVALTVCAVFLFFRFVRRAVVAPLYFCFAVLGVVSAETPLGFVMMLVAATGVLLAANWAASPAVPLVNPFVDGLVRDVAFRRLVNLWGFCFLATLGLDVWLFINMGGPAAAGVQPDVLGVLFICLRSCVAAVKGAVAPVALLFAFLLAVAPFVLAVRALPRAWDDDRFLPFLLSVVYAVVGLVALSQLSGAPVLWFWNWTRSGSMVTSDTALAFILMFDVATVAFSLAVFGVDACCRNYRRIAQKTYPESMQMLEAAKLAESLGRTRVIRRRVFWILLALVPLCALSGRRQTAERGMMSVMDDYLQELLRETTSCDTVFTDGSYDSLLELYARREGRTLNCLSLMTPNSPRERVIRLRAARDAEDEALLNNDSSSALRTWVTEGSNRLDRVAVQLGFEYWRRAKLPAPPFSGLAALPGGVSAGERLRALEACKTLAERIYDLARMHDLAACTDRPLRGKFPFAGFRIARLAQARSRVADESGRRGEAFGEAARADELDSVNYELTALRERANWAKMQKSGVLTPREGLVIGLSRADFAFAGQYAEPILRSDPDDPRANFALGMKFYQEENWSRAEKHLLRCLVRRPDEIAVLNNLAVVEKRLGKLDEAERHARRAFDLHPEIRDVEKTYRDILRIKEEKGKEKK